jgi:hypothetical protein
MTLDFGGTCCIKSWYTFSMVPQILMTALKWRWYRKEMADHTFTRAWKVHTFHLATGKLQCQHNQDLPEDAYDLGMEDSNGDGKTVCIGDGAWTAALLFPSRYVYVGEIPTMRYWVICKWSLVDLLYGITFQISDIRRHNEVERVIGQFLRFTWYLFCFSWPYYIHSLMVNKSRIVLVTVCTNSLAKRK